MFLLSKTRALNLYDPRHWSSHILMIINNARPILMATQSIIIICIAQCMVKLIEIAIIDNDGHRLHIYIIYILCTCIVLGIFQFIFLTGLLKRIRVTHCRCLACSKKPRFAHSDLRRIKAVQVLHNKADFVFNYSTNFCGHYSFLCASLL